jgi:hypothetical protein
MVTKKINKNQNKISVQIDRSRNQYLINRFE